MNPLLKEFNTPYNSVPFEQIQTSHYKPAFLQAIKKAKKEIEIIIKNEQTPSFENTIVALETSGKLLDTISRIFFNLNSAETNEEIQQLAQEISPILTQHSNDIILNQKLFKKVAFVYKNTSQDILTPEQGMLLTKTYKSFSRNGALLQDDQKRELRKINEKLAQLSLQFGENILAETNGYELFIDNEEDLDGLSQSVKDSAFQLAENQNKQGWIFSLQYPSYIPFMTYAKNRDLREKLFKAFGSKGYKQNDHNNESIVLEIVNLRHRKANLLGYKTHANFVLEERMAQTPEKVKLFLNNLLSRAKPFAEKELKELEKIAKKDGVEVLERWDHAYYAEKLKQEKYNFNDELLKPYFKLENVIDGVFKVSNRLFGLQFEEIFDIEKYHPEVKTYKVTDNHGALVAIFYADFYTRKGKRGGAWMTSYKGQSNVNENQQRPHISNVCNFTPSTPKTPSLLTFNEVTTLFHEFGHGLHGMLANTTYESLSGTNVYWDFVELPSQLLENWCYEKEALDLFAKHYETGENIPQEYIDKIKNLKSFMEGYQTVRQVSFGLLDMAWHGENPKMIQSIKAFENKTFASTELYPEVEETLMSSSFSHIFQGGYSSGYYSYKWAEVLDADAFAYFKETGIFNKETASKFKQIILEKGGTESPMDLYKKFRGKEPSEKYLIERAGLSS
ncbi:MAG: M3 family metallopeptidase [Flavobacteriales bacterium]